MKKAIMKKLTVVMVVAAVVLGAASGAMAATTWDMLLTMYGYKNAGGVNQNGVSMDKTFGDMEASYNMGVLQDGSFGELYGPGGANASASFDTGVFLADLTSADVDSWADVQLAVYASFGTPGTFPSAGAYFGAVGAPLVNSSQILNFDSSHLNVAVGQLGSLAVGDSAVYNTSDGNSYVSRINPGIIGNLASMLDSMNAEVNLAALDTGGTAELMFYKAGFTAEGKYETPVQLGTFTFSLDAGGSLVADYAAVPVPAPVLLLASGLLGLIGFRRKHA